MTDSFAVRVAEVPQSVISQLRQQREPKKDRTKKREEQMLENNSKGCSQLLLSVNKRPDIFCCHFKRGSC